MVNKNMLPINLESSTRKKLIDALTKIGFIDGRDLTREQLVKTNNELIFWEDVLDVEVAQKKKFYLVFTIGVPTSKYADNTLLETIVPIEIDIFTTQPIDSKGMYDLRLKFENEMSMNNDFINLELLRKGYEPNFKLSAISYKLERLVTY